MAKIFVKNRLKNVSTFLPGQRINITNDNVIKVEKTKAVVGYLNSNRLKEVDEKDVPKKEEVKPVEKPATDASKTDATTDKKGK